MTVMADFNSPILKFIETHPEFNVTRLATKCELDRVTVSRIAHGRQKPHYETGLKIENVTGDEVKFIDLLNYYHQVQGDLT